jgi:hypothetical protein
MIRPDKTWFLALRDSSSRRTCARISSTEGGAWGSGSGSIASILAVGFGWFSVGIDIGRSEEGVIKG